MKHKSRAKTRNHGVMNMVKPQQPDNSGTPGDTPTFGERVTEAGEHLRQVGTIAKDTAQESITRVKDAARAKYDQGVDSVREFEATLEDRIRESPIKSVLIAAGAGFLLCMFIHRR